MKLYKAALPQDTILRVRTILHNLGINVIEKHFRKDGLYYSCRICIDNEGVGYLDIGTNGKGMNSIYSLASAYGELMERLQNKMLLLVTKYASPDFCSNNALLRDVFYKSLYHRFFPDEKLKRISYQEFNLELKRLCPNSFSVEKIVEEKHSLMEMYYSDFYNVMTKQTESLPYLLIRYAASSTGLCAGNTPSEAILQGLNEIFERYVLQQIYIKRLTPPNIPVELFDGTDILQRLCMLKKETGWSFEIKDCSLGLGFPVIGLLIIDKKNSKYSFRLGADLDKEIALQRCFTETFQGSNVNSKCLTPILLDDNWDIVEEHNRSVVNGRGRFPKEIFSATPSWRFNGVEIHNQNTHKESLLSVIKWLKDKGYVLFVRDNSFLGFPAFHLFIPGLSDVDYCLYNLISEMRKDNEGFYNIKMEYRIPSLTDVEVIQLINKYKNESSNLICLFPYNTNIYNNFDRLLLLALLSYKVGEDLDAYNYMKEYLIKKENEGIRQNVYYYCVRDFYYAKFLNKENSDIKNMLLLIYTESLVNEVIVDLSNRSKVLDNIPLPNCFNCNDCKIKNSCHFNTILDIEKNIQKKQIENYRSQMELSSIFTE